MSAVTGTPTCAAMRATAAAISSREIRSPSGYPSANATPALLVAMAGNPARSTILALATSQTLGRTRIGLPPCRRRNAAARSRWVWRSMAQQVGPVLRGRQPRQSPPLGVALEPLQGRDRERNRPVGLLHPPPQEVGPRAEQQRHHPAVDVGEDHRFDQPGAVIEGDELHRLVAEG